MNRYLQNKSHLGFLLMMTHLIFLFLGKEINILHVYYLIFSGLVVSMTCIFFSLVLPFIPILPAIFAKFHVQHEMLF